LPGDPPKIEQVIVSETRGGKYGFVVDRVIGDHRTVIKKLGDPYRNVEEVSGATILGDGTVAPILDVDKIALEARRDSQHRSACGGVGFCQEGRSRVSFATERLHGIYPSGAPGRNE